MKALNLFVKNVGNHPGSDDPSYGALICLIHKRQLEICCHFIKIIDNVDLCSYDIIKYAFL